MPNLRSKLPLLTAAALLLLLLLPGCARTPDLDSQIHKATAPYRFSLLGWELKTLSGEIFNRRQAATDNATLSEKLLEQQIREAFSGENIHNPAEKLLGKKLDFPPVYIHLGQPPNLLVVSPRDRIEKIRSVTLIPDMDEEAMQTLEAAIDSLGYSSLVVGLGGLATFPSYISRDADISFIVETAAHEWMHQYLAFTPLGFRYVLDVTGIRKDYDIETMNETVADMVGQEIGEIVYQKYYAPPATDNTTPETPEDEFDFNKAMREIRQAVDGYLARGEIEAAEAYMEQQRQYLAANGYYLRKLNQAYFAFHGTYANSPTSVSPIGADIQRLRRESVSLKDFLDRVSAMTDPGELAEAVR
jgi:hypothetical protein